MLAAFLAAVGAAAVPAGGHALLVSTNPTSGATLDEAPTEVVLEFNEPLEPDFGQVQVRGPDEARVDAGAPAIDGSTVAVDLLPLEQPGVHTVAYRVISSDGHPVEGTFTFTLSEAATAGGPDAMQTPAVDGELADDEPADDDPAVASPPQEERTGGGLLVGIFVLAFVLIIAAAALLLAGRRGEDERATP